MATSVDRFSRLKALQRPPGSAAQRLPDLVYEVSVPLSPELPSGAQQLADALGATVKNTELGQHLSLRCWFPDLAEYPSGSSALRLLAPGAPDEIADPQQWLFLDTETTGLAGGTGTYPFLVGLAWWDGGGLEVEQLFIRDLCEESSLLLALSERLQERSVLVTFNGKSFDWPLLETRYRMTRTIPPAAPRAHLDLLHPARNLWRLQLGSVRLQQLESYVLGWERGPDVPSELIPRIYLDFVRGGSPEPLLPVFQHNQMDLRGLAALSCRIFSLLSDPATRGRDALELYAVSRICERRRDLTQARSLYQQSIASILPEPTARAARKSLARLAKRDGDLTLACEL